MNQLKVITLHMFGISNKEINTISLKVCYLWNNTLEAASQNLGLGTHGNK